MTATRIAGRRQAVGALLALLAAPPAWPQDAGAARAPIRLAMIEAFSGPFANTGEAVARNLTFAVERINARGGVALPSGRRSLDC